MILPVKSNSYNLILHAYVKPLHALFYKKITVNGLENLPTDAPVIIAINHQNSAMDAIAVVCATKRQLVFLARGDIFSNPFFKRILHFLRVYPVYRMREGIRNVEKNYESFEMSSQLLKNNEVLCLMPEGGQDEGRTLRPLQKGICRIAFKAQQEMGLDRSLYIVPVGIDYSDYEHSGSNLTVNFGKPISVAWYYNLEPNKAQQKLRSDLTEAMKKQMIHFENNSNYDNLYALMKIYAPRLKEIMLTMQVDDTSNFAVEKMFSEVFTYITAENTESFTNLSMHTSTYFNALNEMGLSDNDLVQSRVPLSKLLLKTCVALFTIPVAIYGFINSFLAILVLHFSLRAFADRQFYSTIRFVVGGVVFPLIYLIQTLIVGCFINNIWVALGYFVSLPLTALFMNWFKGNYGHLPVIYTLKALSRQKGSGLNMLQQLRNQIIRLTDEFIITHSKAQAAKQ